MEAGRAVGDRFVARFIAAGLPLELVASLAASEAHTEYSEDFDDLPEDLDLPGGSGAGVHGHAAVILGWCPTGCGRGPSSAARRSG